ncbi:hypothetical protein V2595_11435 [Tenacibaculum maritimum]|uniref:hypothetical protein n=1 Tax=Tenacibaculum maritimum TaxID=107401 RepID=UPI001915E9E6|nr:hypothetical protein [Tenacibaculum maritimum]
MATILKALNPDSSTWLRKPTSLAQTISLNIALFKKVSKFLTDSVHLFNIRIVFKQDFYSSLLFLYPIIPYFAQQIATSS